ncbi:MAG: hypothetical protein R3311_12930, partial [Oceanisphaera sp.]|nr:hypothetical protein [Oceanisphaera sp.]
KVTTRFKPIHGILSVVKQFSLAVLFNFPLNRNHVVTGKYGQMLKNAEKPCFFVTMLTLFRPLFIFLQGA